MLKILKSKSFLIIVSLGILLAMAIAIAVDSSLASITIVLSVISLVITLFWDPKDFKVYSMTPGCIDIIDVEKGESFLSLGTFSMKTKNSFYLKIISRHPISILNVTDNIEETYTALPIIKQIGFDEKKEYVIRDLPKQEIEERKETEYTK